MSMYVWMIFLLKDLQSEGQYNHSNTIHRLVYISIFEVEISMQKFDAKNYLLANVC